MQLKLENDMTKDFKVVLLFLSFIYYYLYMVVCFQVVIKPVGRIPLDILSRLSDLQTTQLSEVQPAIQALDIVLRNLPSMRYGKSFVLCHCRLMCFCSSGLRLLVGVSLCDLVVECTVIH